MPTIDEKQELAKKADLATKQNILTPGTGITIVNDVISSTGGSTVSVSPTLSSGTPIAAITVDGNINTLFAPTQPTISVTQTQLTGDELATITVNGTPFTIYAPEGTVVLSGTSAPTSAQGSNGDLYVQYTVTSGVYTVDMTYVKLSGEWVKLSAGGGGGGNVDDVYVNGISVLDANKIAQVVSYKEVTQAEYDALPASKLTDNILYCIKDQVTADTTVAPVIYSTDEREIGVWTNGKPLYQKTLEFSSTFIMNNGNQWYNTSFSKGDIDQLVEIIGVQTTGAIYNGLIGGFDNDLISLLTYRYTALDAITLQYTKTTDTPGSGKWAPSGVPAVHYSENEQIIGTWIDGSTLYEKTIKKQNISSVSSSTVLIPSSELTGMNIIEIGGSYVSRTSNSAYVINTYINSSTISATWLAEDNIYYWLYWGAADTYDAYITIRYTKQTS